MPKEILELPEKGFVNAHPSLLPHWRGPSPVQNTILAGDKITGVTIHMVSDKFDSGDILSQKERFFEVVTKTFLKAVGQIKTTILISKYFWASTIVFKS